MVLPDTGSSPDTIRILHLDDDSSITELTHSFLERESEAFDIVTENDPQRALDRVEAERVDCIVSDYDMPGMDGLSFLDAIREVSPEVPFILFTGKGSEEIASEAISRGVTDYIQKEANTDQYTVLANRIQNAVSQYRAEREVERRSEWYSRILEHSSDYVLIVDNEGKVSYVSPAIERVMGYTPEEIIGTNSFQYIHPDYHEDAVNSFLRTVENPDEEVTVEYQSIAKDGSVRWLEVRGSSFLDDPLINGVMVNIRDITERKEREQEIKRQNEQLDQFVSVASHDLQNPLNVAAGHVELARDECNSEHLDTVAQAHERMSELIDELLDLARAGKQVQETEPVDLATLVGECWKNVDTAEASLVVETGLTVEADPSRLRQLAENLFRNAVEHAGTDVTVTVGEFPDARGFYVVDDGPGIPEADRELVFEGGYSSVEDGTGFGLSIVRQVASAHDWKVELTESEAGGARFEITGVELVER